MKEKIDDVRLRALPGYKLRRAYAALVGIHRDGWMHEFQIGIFDYALLILIDANPGIRASQLCKTLDIAKPNMVGFIDRLEARGWLTRERSKKDARVHELRLSSLGCEVAKKIEKSAMTSELKRLEVLNAKEIAQLGSLLERVYESPA